MAIRSLRSECTPIDLDGESSYTHGTTPVDAPFHFDDLGGNECGCGDDRWPCQVKSTSLTAPEPLDPSGP